MANKILKRTSFGLLRTNPRLTTNVKLVADSTDNIYLETIDSNPLLNSSIFKKYSTSSTYSQDLFTFFSQNGGFPLNLVYEVFEEDGQISVKDRYKYQRDFTYAFGTYPKNSTLYSEEYAMFAPLWLEKDNIPEYFVIFRMNGPVTKNINTEEYAPYNKDTDEVFQTLIESPDNFFENYIKKAKIVAQFDLTENTKIGSYIRSHVNDPDFPEAPFYLSADRNELSYWQGISLDKGGFAKKSETLNDEYVLSDKTIIESEDFITYGFSRNNIVLANLLNMEFLFDDPDQEDYKFYRYFGLYINAVELGKFEIDKDRLYADREIESDQQPKPIIPNIGNPLDLNNQYQYNPLGIKVYPKVNYSWKGTTGIYSGRLINWSEIQNPRLSYVKDGSGNLYSISNERDWSSEYSIPGSTSIGVDTNYLRIKDEKVNWTVFGGYQSPFQYIQSIPTTKKGVANFSFDVLGTPGSRDQIRIKYIDWTNTKAQTKITTGSTFKTLIDQFTVYADDTLDAGVTSNLAYSTKGTTTQIALAIATAINNINKLVTLDPSNFEEENAFVAISQGPSVIVYYRNESENWNGIPFSIYTEGMNGIIPYSKPTILEDYQSNYTYLPSPIWTPTGATFNATRTGNFFSYEFKGANTNPKSRWIIEREFVDEFLDIQDPVFIGTETGFDGIKYEYSYYLDEPFYEDSRLIGYKNFEKYYVLSLSDTKQSVDFGSDNKIALQITRKNSNGYLSILPVRDFDFDFFNEDYNKDGDASLDSLFTWEKGGSVSGYGIIVGATVSSGVTSGYFTYTENAFVDQLGYPLVVGNNSEGLRVIFSKGETGNQGATGIALNKNQIYCSIDYGKNWNGILSSVSSEYKDLAWLGGSTFGLGSTSYQGFSYVERLNSGGSRIIGLIITGPTSFIQSTLDYSSSIYPKMNLNSITASESPYIVHSAGGPAHPVPTTWPKIYDKTPNNIRPLTKAQQVFPTDELGDILQLAFNDSYFISTAEADKIIYTRLLGPTAPTTEISLNLLSSDGLRPYNISGMLFANFNTTGASGTYSATGPYREMSDAVGFPILTSININSYPSGGLWTLDDEKRTIDYWLDPTNSSTSFFGGATCFYQFGSNNSRLSQNYSRNKIRYPLGNMNYWYNSTTQQNFVQGIYLVDESAGNNTYLTSGILPLALVYNITETNYYGGIWKLRSEQPSGFTAGQLEYRYPLGSNGAGNYAFTIEAPWPSKFINFIHGGFGPKTIPDNVNPDPDVIWSPGLVGPSAVTGDFPCWKLDANWATNITNPPFSGPLYTPGMVANEGYELPSSPGSNIGDFYWWINSSYYAQTHQGSFYTPETHNKPGVMFKWDGSTWRTLTADELNLIYTNPGQIITETVESLTNEPMWFGFTPVGGSQYASEGGNIKQSGGSIYSYDGVRGISAMFWFSSGSTLNPKGTPLADQTTEYNKIWGTTRESLFSFDIATYFDFLYNWQFNPQFNQYLPTAGAIPSQFKKSTGTFFAGTLFGSSIIGDLEWYNKQTNFAIPTGGTGYILGNATQSGPNGFGTVFKANSDVENIVNETNNSDRLSVLVNWNNQNGSNVYNPATVAYDEAGATFAMGFSRTGGTAGVPPLFTGVFYKIDEEIGSTGHIVNVTFDFGGTGTTSTETPVDVFNPEWNSGFFGINAKTNEFVSIAKGKTYSGATAQPIIGLVNPATPLGSTGPWIVSYYEGSTGYQNMGYTGGGTEPPGSTGFFNSFEQIKHMDWLGSTGSYVGTINGTILTVTSIIAGEVQLGQRLHGGGVADNTIITNRITGFGGTGTYTVSVSQSILGATAFIASHDGYYVISGKPKTAGQTSIMMSRNQYAFSPSTDYGIIKPFSIGASALLGPAYATHAFENEFGLISLWSITDNGQLMNSIIGSTGSEVQWANTPLIGSTASVSFFMNDLEVFLPEVPNTNPYIQWYALTSESKNNIEESIGEENPFSIRGGFQRLTPLFDEFDDTADTITNEYDRLKENDNPILSVYSRVVPFINKWVYDNESTDVRENGYRLNADQAFGMFNFSPSFDEYTRNAKLFTHEWYYLQEYPLYMTFDQKRNSFSYFEDAIVNGMTGPTSNYQSLTGITGGSGGGVLSVIDDYFVEYFTRESVDGYPVPRDFKYSIFNGGNDIKFAETLFRGIKVAIKDRSENSSINYNLEGIRVIPSARYDDYKFSCVLTYGDSTVLKVIKNDKWKAITLLIEANVEDVLLKNRNGDKFIDRSYLYSASDKFSYIGYGGQFLYADTIMKGSILGWVDNGEYFEVYTGFDLNGESPDFGNEIALNPLGGFNSVYLTNSVGNASYVYKFNGISGISTNTFRAESIDGLPGYSTIYPNGSNSYTDIRNTWPVSLRSDYAKPFQEKVGSRIYYQFGGFNAYDSIITEISFASIANAINSGDPHVQYIQVNEDGTIDFNTFLLELIRNDEVVKASFLDVQKTTESPSALATSVDVGFDLIASDRISFSNMYRYRGSYVPRWNDVIKFVDEPDLNSQDLDFYNINIWDVQRGGSGSTASPYFYWKDEELGIIPNLYVYKVNIENPNIVLGQNLTGSTRSIYPLIGEIPIDKKNFFVFKSNWDPYYYWKYLKANLSSPVIGTREPKEEKAFFGSKVIGIPDGVLIDTFPGGTVGRDELRNTSRIKTISANVAVQIISSTPNPVPTSDFTEPIVVTLSNGQKVIKQPQVPTSGQTNTTIELDVYVTGALKEWLINAGFASEFRKYMDPNYTFGERDVDDDVRLYIEENIFDRYQIAEIRFYEKIYQKGQSTEPQIQLNYTDSQKISNGYVRSSNFQTTPLGENSLNFRLIYNLPVDKKTSISFTVVLNKK
jgi:hypothetical protein